MHVISSAASHMQCHGLCGRKFEVREFFVILNKALAVDIRLRAILPGYREKGLFWFSLDGEQSLSPISPPRGGGVLSYITYTGMCRPTGRDFEAPDLERAIHFRGVF